MPYTAITDYPFVSCLILDSSYKEGQLILKRTYNQEPGQSPVPLDTYYVYDQYGNLTYVLPPKRTTSGVIDLGKYCYQYKYDSRNRLIEKKLPGKTWEFLVYDKLDRVVATGPAINPWGGLDTDTGWLVTQYDAFGRVAYTGWVAATGFGTTLRRDMQLLTWNITAKTTSSVSINSISVYYTNTLPSSLQSGFKLLTVNYYDNYVYPNATAPTSSTQVEGVNVQVDCKGLPTGTWVRALQTATAGELSYTFYDKKGRPLRTRTTNYLGGYTQLDSKLGFDGRVLYAVTRHKRLIGNTELKTTETFDYTAQDRLLSQTHQIGSQATQLMAFNTYNAIGQLTSKKVGNTSSSPLQQIDYKYNIRGWLTSINNVLELNNWISPNLPSDQPQDLFAYKINYTAIAQQSIGGAVVPQYNGNIAEVSWRTATDNIQRRYGFTYDKLNRLTDAWYQIPQASFPVRNSYDEHVQYDDNGNIRSLQRNGGQDTLPPATEIDELTYFYDGNQLTKVTDTGDTSTGFKDVEQSGVDDYTYDAFGNLTSDNNKGITGITYNHLNQPVTLTVTRSGISHTISYLYNAAGVKLKKTVTPSGGTAVVTDYLGGYQYVGTVLEFFPTSEGYVKHTLVGSVSNYNYVFQYKDHLGNNRVSYTVDPSDNVLKILEEDHYYPFGLLHEGYSSSQSMLKGSSGTGVHIVPVLSPSDITYTYMYGSKELQYEFLLNNYDFGARHYDPGIGRWMSIDKLAEKHPNNSSYVYANNNPVLYIDPDGKDFIFYYQDANGQQQEYRFTGGETQSVAPTEYIQQFQDAYYYSVNNLPGMTALQYIAEHSDVRVNVQNPDGTMTPITSPSSKDGNPFHAVIDWNPEWGLETSNEIILSPATLLEHDANHALGIALWPEEIESNKAEKVPYYENVEELRVIMTPEQLIAYANGEIRLGQVTREDHFGIPVVTESATSHKVNMKATSDFYNSYNGTITTPSGNNSYKYRTQY